MSRPVRVFLGVTFVALGLLVVATAIKTSSLAFSLGTTTSAVAVKVGPRDEACQRPISVPDDGGFKALRLSLGTYRRPGPPLTAVVTGPGGRNHSQGHLAGGYPDVGERPTQVIPLDAIVGPGEISVCIQNEGRHSVALYGTGDAADPDSTAYLDGKPVGTDIDVSFLREPRSYLKSSMSIARRAVLFRGPRVSGAVYLGFLALLVIGAAAALAVALRPEDTG